MSSAAPTRHRARTAEIDPQKYGIFIAQIELRTIWLAHTEVTNHAGPNPPKQATFHIQEEPRWERSPEGFNAFQTYSIQLKDGDSPAMEMKVEFGLAYSSEMPMTEEIFEVFKGVNLPVNIWPYLREYQSNMLGRMSWPPFTLPVFRVNTPPTSSESGEKDVKRKRPVRKAKAVEELSE